MFDASARYDRRSLSIRFEAFAVIHQPRYSPEEHARLGKAIYDERIRPLVEPTEIGRVVAIDVDSGDYEVADDTLTATDRLYVRRPDAQPWIIRVGFPGVHRFGPRSVPRSAG
jgi:hypothetical protein